MSLSAQRARNLWYRSALRCADVAPSIHFGVRPALPPSAGSGGERPGPMRMVGPTPLVPTHAAGGFEVDRAGSPRTGA
jgi:hypothetical protein